MKSNSELLCEKVISLMEREVNSINIISKLVDMAEEDFGADFLEIVYHIDNSQRSTTLLDKGNVDLTTAYSIKHEMRYSNIDIDIVLYRKHEKGDWSEADHNLMNLIMRMVYLNIDRLKYREENAHYRQTDPQTGVPNMFGIKGYVEALMLSYNIDSCTMIYFNLKNFKVINNNYGNEVANEILTTFALKLYESITSYGMLGRVSGDNFIAIVFNEYLEDFLGKLQGFPIAIDTDNGIEQLVISARAGVYQIRGDESSPQEIINNVTNTFEICRKDLTKDVIFFDNDVNNLIIQDKQLENRIIPGLENEEFLVYLQPKVNLDDYEIIGAEALVRWQIEGNILSPIKFIPLFENNGMICKLDFYVLEKVCQYLRKWIDSGLDPVRVSVNFSKKNFYRKDTAADIISIINKYNLDSRYLEIEFTETAYLTEYENLVNTLHTLKETGMYTSMDDFGIGYSSIMLLQDLDVDVLKLDKTFLNKENDKRNTIICENIVKMAKELGMEVICEGVETKQQVRFLKAIGCSKAQGYLFDRPLEVSEFEKRLAQKTYDFDNIENA